MDEKSQAAADYFKALESLEELRQQGAPIHEVNAAKAEAARAWAKVKTLMPGAMCR